MQNSVPDLSSTLSELSGDRVIAVVRASSIPDAPALCAALAAGGIRWVELTYTTPGVAAHLRSATAAGTGCRIGVGTVLTQAQAEEALEAGAEFLVTPGRRPAVAKAAGAAGIALVMGALTPSEVADAVDLGAMAVKIFPAKSFGPGYFKDLAGPYPDIPLVASGGVNAENAHAFLSHGARAVCAGTDVVPPAAVEAGDWAGITRRAEAFVASLTP